MTGNENPSPESPPDLQLSGERQLHDLEQEPSTYQDASRQLESNRKMACVLVGNAILQLPIWGKSVYILEHTSTYISGFAMSYGVFQEYLTSNWTLKENRDITGIVGTTFNGVVYLSMPFLFALFSKRWARKRQTAALCGAALTCFGSSFSGDHGRNTFI